MIQPLCEGLGGRLQHPLTNRPVSAREAMQAVLGAVSDALDETGDRITVQDLTEQVLRRGSGAAQQRQAFHRRASRSAVGRAAIGLTRAL